MVTQVIMQREFLGHSVGQQSKSELMNATDLVRICNIKRRELGKPIFNFSAYLNSKTTKEFIEELQKTSPIVISKGSIKKSQTWVHPLLFIDIALSIDPKLKILVYKWIQDELLKVRNDSGDSYKKMCGALYERASDKQNFHKEISKLATLIKEKIGVEDWNKASKEQLLKRDKMHDNITLLCSALTDIKQAIRIGIESV